MYLMYWFKRDSFNPNFCLRISLETSSAPDPRIASTGSPGATLNKIKTHVQITPSIKGIRMIFRKE